MVLPRLGYLQLRQSTCCRRVGNVRSIVASSLDVFSASLAFPLGMFLVSRALLGVIIYVATTVPLTVELQDVRIPNLDPLMAILKQSDGAWYVSIAANGYDYDPTKQSSVAFFPLYPLIVKLSGLVVGDLSLSAILTSNLAFLIALLLIYRITEVRSNRLAARASVALLAFYPFSFFFSAAYSESLFLLLTVAAFHSAERKYWVLASVFGMLASATRLIGVAIFPALLIMYWQHCHLYGKVSWQEVFRTWRWRNTFEVLSFGLVPLGVVSFALFLWWRYGDPLVFASNNVDTWGDPWLALKILAARVFGQPSPDTITLPYYWHLTALAVFLLLIFASATGRVRRDVGLPYAVFSALVLIIPLVSHLSFISGRYSAVVFPVFVTAGMTLAGRKAMLPLFGFFAALLSVLVALYSLGAPII